MDLFESSRGNGNVILVMNKKEGKILIAAMEEAVKHNKRKRTWKKLWEHLKHELAVY